MTITVAANNARIRYTATSSQTAFAIPFEFFENDEIHVYVASTALVAASERGQGTGSTEYGISGGGGSTGAIAFVTGITQGHIVTIVRDIPIERITDFTAGTTINRAALNTQLDTLTAMVGDLKDKSDRAIRLQPYDSEISLFLPTIDSRAGKIFGFDTNGNLTADTSANFDITLDDVVTNTLTMTGNANSKVNLTAVLDSQILTNGAVLNIKSTKGSNTATMTLDGSTTYGIDFNAGNKAIRMQDATLFSSTAEVTGALTAPLIVSQSGGSITLQPTGNQVYIKGTGGESRITFHNPAAPSMEFTGDSSLIGSGTFLIDIAGDITLDADGGQIYFKDGAAASLTFNVSTTPSIVSVGNLSIETASGDIDLKAAGGQINVLGTSGQQRILFDNAASATMQYFQNSNITKLGVVDPTGTRTLLLPDESGTIHSSGGATTHANITVSTDGKVQFRDSAIYIQSGADGHLDLVADTEIHIAATTVNVDGLMDVSGNLSVGGNFDVTGTIDFSDANITNVGSISLDKVTNDGGAGITLDSSAGIVIDSSTGQIVFKDDNVTRLTVAVSSGATQSITSVAGLKLNSGADITLEADGGQVYITDPNGNDNFQFNGSSTPTLGIHQNSNVTNLGLVNPTATRTILFPDASDTLVGKATTDTLTNKTLTAPTLTGTTVVASLDISGDIDVDGTTNLDVVDIDGAVNMATTALVTGVLTTTAKAVSNGGIGIPDNVKLTFGGTGTGDLQIFHDGTNSYSAISDQGTGPLVLLSNNLLVQNAGGTENMIKALDGGAVELYHNNGKKFETTSAGATVTGSVFSVDAVSGGRSFDLIVDSANSYLDVSHNLILRTNGASSLSEKMRITDAGRVGIGTSSPDNNLEIFTNSGDQGITIKSTGNTSSALIFDAVRNANSAISVVGGQWNGTRVADMIFYAGADYTNKDDGYIVFRTSSADNIAERMRIDSSGNVGIGVSAPAAKLDIRPANEAANTFRIYRGISGGYHLDYLNISQYAGDSVFNSYSDGASNSEFIFQQNGTERMRIGQSGRVMIGTTTEGNVDADNLTISGDNRVGMTIRSANSGSSRIYFSDGTSGAAEYVGYITYDHAGNHLRFGTAAAEAMRIHANGYASLGTAADYGGQLSIRFDAGTNQGIHVRADQSSGSYNYIGFSDNNAETVGRLQGNTANNTMALLNGSDYRLKENINYDWDATSKIKQLKPATFKYKKDPENTVEGFIAHEAQQVLDSYASGTKDEIDSDGNPIMQGMDYSKLVPLLAKTIQELEARITALEG